MTCPWCKKEKTQEEMCRALDGDAICTACFAIIWDDAGDAAE